MVADPALFWTKIGFCLFAFFEAFGSGIFPTISKSCRESPKILGIANAFAAGVFMGIAFVHILPEMTAEWAEIEASKGVTHIFPMPELLVVCGYTFILIIDKVLFDTHALFEHDEHGEGGHSHDGAVDPAEQKFRNNLRASYANIAAAEQSGDPNQVRRSMLTANTNIEKEIKEYLNPNERFAARMKASYSKQSTTPDNISAQQSLFVDGA
jgi:zinc transporter ZupT